ncbi:MAG: iron ABC transporter permease [Paludibacteraceae bacterium]|nr:iron ABC transporter permease [Paludibacteraceae bacterium]
MPINRTNSHRNTLLFIGLLLLCALFFIVDLVFGSISIPLSDVIKSFTGQNEQSTYNEIIINFRLPKALTAILAGAALSVAGLLMQTLFQNPLAGPDVLGVSSGASLGVALFLMVGSFLPFVGIHSGLGIVIAAVIGAVGILLLMLSASVKIRNSVSLLIIGIMVGSMTGAMVSIIQNYSNPDALKLFVVWTLGSLSAVSWTYMQLMAPLVILGLGISFFIQKQLNALLLGENYASGLGVAVFRVRFLIIIATGILAGATTAFTGPIAFIGVAVPHIARGLFRSSNHKIILPASLLCGSGLLLVCDIVSQISIYTIPINAISSLFGAPLIIWIILTNGKKQV